MDYFKLFLQKKGMKVIRILVIEDVAEQDVPTKKLLVKL